MCRRPRARTVAFQSVSTVHCLGTARANHLQGCLLPTDASLKKKGRGSFEEFERVIDASKIIALKWYDNRAVTTLSTFAGAQPVTSADRCERTQKKTVQVDCPSAVSIYNKSMGGVDQLDALIAFYRIHTRSSKSYLKIFLHFVDMAVVVSWLLYRRDCFTGCSCQAADGPPQVQILHHHMSEAGHRH